MTSLGLVGSAGAEPLPHSVLVLSQWDPGLPWYAAVLSAFQGTLRGAFSEPVSIYSEALDLSRFNNPSYQENVRRNLRDKYREKNIDVIVTVGPLALEFVLNGRSEAWSTVPVIFNAVDEATFAQVKLAPNVTGTIIQLTLRDMVRRRLVSDQIRQIEDARLQHLKQAPSDGPHAMVRLLARVIGVGIETADMLVQEVLSRNMRDRRAVARYAGLTARQTRAAQNDERKG
jgi:hypothetical protein